MHHSKYFSQLFRSLWIVLDHQFFFRSFFSGFVVHLFNEWNMVGTLGALYTLSTSSMSHSVAVIVANSISRTLCTANAWRVGERMVAAGSSMELMAFAVVAKDK